MDAEAKPAAAGTYYSRARSEMLPFLPASAKRILEVGCGVGAFARLVKESRGCEYWGVEPNPATWGAARKAVDRLIEGPFAPAALRGEAFDCVVFNDVLEHLQNPEGALHDTRLLLLPGGHVVASVPNIRCFPYLYRLAWLGELEYEDAGVLDRTHLRLFTPRSIRRLFLRQGYVVRTIRGINSFLTRGESASLHVLNLLTLGRFRDARYSQIVVVAEREP